MGIGKIHATPVLNPSSAHESTVEPFQNMKSSLPASPQRKAIPSRHPKITKEKPKLTIQDQMKDKTEENIKTSRFQNLP